MKAFICAGLLFSTLVTSVALGECGAGLRGGGFFSRLRERRLARQEARAERRASRLGYACDLEYEVEHACSAYEQIYNNRTLEPTPASPTLSGTVLKIPVIQASFLNNSYGLCMSDSEVLSIVSDLRTIICGQDRSI